MSLIKTKSSPFFYSTITISGKTYRRSTKTKDRRMAELFDDSHRNELIEKLHGNSKKTIGLKEAIMLHLVYKDKLETGQHKYIFKNLDKPIHEIVTQDLTKFVVGLRQLKYKERSIHQYLSHIKSAINFAKLQDYEVNAELIYPQLNIKTNMIKILTIAEESKLLMLLDPKRDIQNHHPYGTRSKETQKEVQDMYDLTILLLDTGARLTEITKLKWDQIDLNEGTLHLYRSKVNNSSVLKMTLRCIDVLTQKKETMINQWVFNSRDGGHRLPPNRPLRNALKSIDPTLTIHHLRHIYASKLAAQGMGITEIGAILGHSHATMTEHYAHLTAEKPSAKAAKILDEMHIRTEQETTSHLVQW